MELMMLNPFDQKTAKKFFADIWQKKPYLIKSALKNKKWSLPLTSDELAGLSCEDDINAKIVQLKKSGKKTTYSVQYGPFNDSTFKNLKDKDWTLLVNDMEHYLDEFNDLKKMLKLLPKWRFDDVMISYSEVGGSVGPHLDHYDVFLFQVQGEKEWVIEKKPRDNWGRDLENKSSSGELRQVSDFKKDLRFHLREGDILYLPAHYAHHGIALTKGMTVSIGFRSPSSSEVLQNFIFELQENKGEFYRFKDEYFKSVKEILQYEITQKHVQSFLKELCFDEKLLKKKKTYYEQLIIALGRTLTTPKRGIQSNVFPFDRCSDKELDRYLKTHAAEDIQSSKVLFAFIKDPKITKKNIYLFFNGYCFLRPKLPSSLLKID